MNFDSINHSVGFARRELIVVLVTLGILVVLAIPWWNNARLKSRSLCCNCNLKEIDLSFKVWSGDTNADGLFPMVVSTNSGGAKELVASQGPALVFQIMSNEIGSVKTLVCPADTREPAADFVSIANTNVSYFVGIDANGSVPEMFLSGDRNITNGNVMPDNILELQPNSSVGWTHALHNHFGNIALVNGSV